MRESDTDKGKKRIEVMADKCARMAESGDMAAIREIGDRLDGKPAQYSEIAGAGGEQLQLTVETGVPLRAVERGDTKPNGTAKNGASDATTGLDDD